MTAPFQECIAAYQAHFFHRTAVTVPTYLAYFHQLAAELSNNSEEGIAQILLLTGAKGCGRKKFMSRLAEEKNVEHINIVDCGLFNTETRLWERIYKDCREEAVREHKTSAKEGDKEEAADIVEDDGKMKQLFETFLRNKKTMIYLDNIQIFCERRQTFLYSFLDNILLLRTKLWLVFGTTDLFFHDKLEKRVKSRFNFLNLVFDFNHTCPHRFIVDYCQEGRHLPFLKVFSSWMAAAATTQLVSRITDFCFDLGALLRWIHAALCYAPPQEFFIALQNPSKPLRVVLSSREHEFRNGEAFFVKCLEFAYSSLFRFDPRPLIACLPDLHRLILTIVADECNVNAGQYSTSMQRIIENVRRLKSSHAYTQDAMLFAVDELVAQDMLSIVEGSVSSSSRVLFRLDHEALAILRAWKKGP